MHKKRTGSISSGW